jgi:hypothetical protein
MCQFVGFLPVSTVEPPELNENDLNANLQQTMLSELVSISFPGQPLPPSSPKFSYYPLKADLPTDEMLDDMLLSQFYADIPTRNVADPPPFDSWLCFADLEPLPILSQHDQQLPLLLQQQPLLFQQEPLLARQICSNCATQSTPLWRKNHEGLILCNVPLNLIKGMWNL